MFVPSMAPPVILRASFGPERALSRRRSGIRVASPTVEETPKNAREGNVEARTEGQARRQGTVDAGRRVRARRDAPHPRGQARRRVDEAGDRDWPVEGAPLRGEARPPATQRQGDDASQRQERGTRGTKRNEG